MVEMIQMQKPVPGGDDRKGRRECGVGTGMHGMVACEAEGWK